SLTKGACQFLNSKKTVNMENKRKTKILSLSFLAMILVASSCNKKEDPLPMETGIQRSSLSFTEVVGEPHGDHFHGLGELTGSKTHTLSFDSEGKVQSGGHFH